MPKATATRSRAKAGLTNQPSSTGGQRQANLLAQDENNAPAGAGPVHHALSELHILHAPRVPLTSSAVDKDAGPTARAQRQLRRDAHRFGLVETPEAAEHWKFLESDKATAEDQRAQKEKLERKILKLKTKIQNLTTVVNSLQAQLQTAKQEKQDVDEQVRGLETRMKHKQDDATRYYELFAEAEAEIDRLQEQIRTGQSPGGYGQAARLRSTYRWPDS
ncbi:hypothetical protein NMY22_g8115 [Coprinellus aureogranulatus]|nr:hypothetical protein NMY22_g8115 [Coprinellus aureogranulatus]